ncbi:discoidin domain-containing protein [Nonomuraea ceibae]|uniref:discoidin domain-containing protein n=1 Tax=Nonomuraea ceibae TaxID=1935170 RepID=UPI001C5FC9CC|nr:discoidin domain-containing protein [Nonomuraea ceibae]
MRHLRIAAATALALGALAVPATGAPRLPATPAGQVLVVQAGLQDSVRPADARDTRDLDTFARRLAGKVPAAPDALVLTEVLGPGARRLATKLSQATGYRYRVMAAGERTAFLPDGAVRENAVILNTDTMLAEQPGGFHRVQDEDQAYVAAARRDGTLRVPLLAAHPGGDPATAVPQLADRFPRARGQVTVLGGDFRAGRCATPSADQAAGCAPQAFWSSLTGPGAYSDALFDKGDAHTRPLTGYLFARGDVLAAGYDRDLPDVAACKAAFDAGRSGTAPPACRSDYYADAPFSWALLAAGRDVQQAVTPARIALDHCELAVRVADVVVRAVNNTGEPVSLPVTVDAPAPLAATAPAALDVPAGQGGGVVVKVTAPRDTPPGEHRLTVRAGSETTEVPVTVTETCSEPAVYATSFHAGNGPELAVDGDIATFWHSEYQPLTPLPQSITLNLGETRQVSALDYQPRFDGNLNGTILDYHVYVSADGREFTKVASGSWALDARLKTAAFPAVTARYVRLEGTRGHNGQYLSAAEITPR